MLDNTKPFACSGGPGFLGDDRYIPEYVNFSANPTREITDSMQWTFYGEAFIA